MCFLSKNQLLYLIKSFDLIGDKVSLIYQFPRKLLKYY